MRTYDRNYIYESNDFENLCKFIIQDNSLKKEYFVWHIGRIVDWKYNLSNLKKHFPDNFNKAAHLWFDYLHNLIGFVILEDFNNEFTIFLKDQYSYLYPELLNWVKIEWGNKYDQLVTSALQTQTEYIKFLEDAGYKKNSCLEMTRVFNTSFYKDYTIEDPSVSFQNMYENGDYEEQANLRTNAWPKTYSREINLQIKEYTRQSPIYNAKFDFVLVNNEGRHISGCEAFIDYENNTAEIERVCTHTDFYNKGYAQMVLKACMKKLFENNILTAFISGGYDKTIHLYGKLGHVSEYARYSFELQTIK
jgi:hypothetical protein